MLGARERAPKPHFTRQGAPAPNRRPEAFPEVKGLLRVGQAPAKPPPLSAAAAS